MGDLDGKSLSQQLVNGHRPKQSGSVIFKTNENKYMSSFLLSIVSIKTMSLFQLLGATILFLEKVAFPVSPFCIENYLLNE